MFCEQFFAYLFDLFFINGERDQTISRSIPALVGKIPSPDMDGNELRKIRTLSQGPKMI